MSARDKLNAAFVLGSVAVAAVLGGLTQSWIVFAIFALLLLLVSFLSGNIRPRG